MACAAYTPLCSPHGSSRSQRRARPGGTSTGRIWVMYKTIYLISQKTTKYRKQIVKTF